jgi:hypothetical protein
MASRSRHPNTEIEAAVRYAEAKGWRFTKGKGHGWGRVLCRLKTRDGCQISIWSTPKNPEEHAKSIMRAVDRCGHGAEDEDI